MKNFLHFVIFFLVFGFLTIFFPNFLYAQSDPINLAVSPPIMDHLTASPGDTVIESIHLNNYSTHTETISTSFEDYVANGDSGKVSLIKNSANKSYSLASWMKVTPSTFNLASHGSNDIQLVIVVPKNAEAGGKYSAVVFSALPNATSSDTNEVRTNIASLILLTVKGDIHYNAHIANVSLQPQISFWPTMPTLQFHVFNRGNTHIEVNPRVSVQSIFVKDPQIITMKQAIILPSANRMFQQKLSSSLNIGMNTVTIDASFRDGTKYIPLKASLLSIYIPLFPILGILVIIAILYYILKNFSLTRKTK